uniref:Mitochondrial carrier protein n=1 Tax=Odontella aurita TaxID=265563 RepID=A0A7S4IZX9_9STRA|mmetsp:Transcript_34416/g.102994  ORF Transcript_34416/g.102994 Transcript_34416/m.102994 type:complete len:284 (+) Transcript_34416:143-994(+)
MAHTERRSTPQREFLIATFTGAVYGSSHTLSGHPLDNIKAVMQLDPAYRGLSTAQSVSRLWSEHGIRGFTRGIVPPLVGSALYRSVMLSTYEFAYTWFDQRVPDDSAWKKEIWGGYFPRPCVWASATFCSLARSAVEAPFEQAKVMRQTGRTWSLSPDLYRGAGVQAARTTGMLVMIFGPYDVIRRKTDWMKDSLLNQFFVVTAVCGAAYALVWPLETLKNAAQAGLPRPGASLAERVRHLGGLVGLYRGALPGISGGAIRNGVAMLAMANTQRVATWLGLRD